MKTMKFEGGEIIVKQGDTADSIYLIQAHASHAPNLMHRLSRTTSDVQPHKHRL